MYALPLSIWIELRKHWRSKVIDEIIPGGGLTQWEDLSDNYRNLVSDQNWSDVAQSAGGDARHGTVAGGWFARLKDIADAVDDQSSSKLKWLEARTMLIGFVDQIDGIIAEYEQHPYH
jgi:hypothetical protein